MSPIERFFAALLLAGAVAGAAAFSYSLGNSANPTVSAASLGRPGSPGGTTSVVRVAALPGLTETLRPAVHAAAARPAGQPAAPVRRLVVPVVAVPAHVRHVTPTPAPAAPVAHTPKAAPQPAAPASTPAPVPPTTPAPTAPAPAAAPAAPTTPVSGPAAETPVTPVVTTPVLTPVAPTPSPGRKHGWWKNGKWSEDQSLSSGKPVADSVAPTVTATVDATVPLTPAAPSSDDVQPGNGRHGGGWKRDK